MYHSSFTSTRPELMTNHMTSTISKMLARPAHDSSQDVTNALKQLYNNYIEPNLLEWLILFMIVGYLLWRYYNRAELRRRNENQRAYELKRDKQREKFIPMMNPSISPRKQTNFTYYTPNDDITWIDGKQQSYHDVHPFDRPPLVYPPEKEPRQNRDDFTAMESSWNGSPGNSPIWFSDVAEQHNDWPMEHPYGWAMDMNQTTGDAVNFAVERNRAAQSVLNTHFDI